MGDLETLDRVRQAVASFLASEGTLAEGLVDAYEEVSAVLRQPAARSGALMRGAERLKEDLDRHASQLGTDTVMAIALMDETAVRYWATRILTLPEAARAVEAPQGGRAPVTR